MTHQYPDNTLEKALQARGFHVQCNWQIKGPKNTEIVWMEHLYASNGRVAGGMIVQTFKYDGWNVYVEPTKSNDTEATIAAVVKSIEGSCP